MITIANDIFPRLQRSLPRIIGGIDPELLSRDSRLRNAVRVARLQISRMERAARRPKNAKSVSQSADVTSEPSR